MAALVKVDVPGALRRFHAPAGLAVPSEGPIDDALLAEWLSTLRGTIPINTLAEATGRSRFVITRWLGGKSRPRIADFLLLLEIMTGRAADLVAELVEIHEVPILLDVRKRRVEAKELAFSEPWTEAIMRLFETTQYRELPRHDHSWLAVRLGIPLKTVARCVDCMVATGLIEFDEGRLVVMHSLTIDTGSHSDRIGELKEHWANVALQRSRTPRPGDLMSYNVMSLSMTDLERVRTLLRKTYREIRSIVASTENEETAALMQVNLLGWDSPETEPGPQQ